MANDIFNIARGRINELQRRVNNNDPANAAFIVVALKSVVVDATLQDFATLSAILADAGNTEADFTNYGRIILTDTDVSDPTVDHGNNEQRAQVPPVTFANAGGALNNALEKLLVCFTYDVTVNDDATVIPLTYHDFNKTTNGLDLPAGFSGDTFYKAH